MNYPEQGMVESLKDVSFVERGVEVERQQDGYQIKGDWEGTVIASWVRFNEDGTGRVDYNGRKYNTKIVGLTSISPGTLVSVTFADGAYVSFF